MSKSLIEDISSLYNDICISEKEVFNENSEHYDAEVAELVEDIFYNISYSMASEGYSANGILDFLSKASEQDILEKYYDCTISEGLVSEEYILEQLEIIDEGIGSLFKVLGKGLGMGAKALVKGAGTALKGTGRTISVATKRAIGPGARKTIKGAVTKVKDIAKGAKAALTSPTAKKIGLGALGAGALVGLPYVGAKLAGAGGEGVPKMSPSDGGDGGAVKDLTAYRAGGGGAKSRKTGMTTREIEDLGRKNLAVKPASTGQQPSASAGQQPSASAGQQPSASAGQRPSATKSTPKPSVKPKPQIKPSGQSKAEKDAEELRMMQNRSKQRQGALMGGEEGPGKIDVKSVEADIKAEKERQERKSEQKTPTPTSSSGNKATGSKKPGSIVSHVEYDAYDLVLEYLLGSGHAETLDEAHYIMLEMDSNMIGSIVESFIY